MMAAGQIHFGAWEQALLSETAAKRLLVACVCGGLVGAQRELRHKSSGLRTNMLIAMGAALFTVMSQVLAGATTVDKSRIASNIVQGVGFLGAGLILHNKSRVLGLTTAATVFVVAAIGMTCGAGLYMEAAVATALVLVALWGVGALESKVGWQRYPMLYEVRADVGDVLSKETVGVQAAADLAERSDAARRRMFTAVLKVLDGAGLRLEVEEHQNVAGLERVLFSVLATRRVHARLLTELRASDATDQVLVFRDVEDV